MFDSLLSYFNSDTLKKSFIASTGTTINAILGAIFYIYIARALGPSDFGIFTVAIVTLTLISDIFNFGTNTGIVNFVSRYKVSNPKKSDQFLKLALNIKLIVVVGLLIVGNIFAQFIANNIFAKPELELPLRLVFLGVGSAQLFSFATSTLQAYQKFAVWSSLQILTNALRLISVVIVQYLWSLTIVDSLLVYLIYPFIGFLLVFIFIPKSFLNVKGENNRFKEFFTYNKWVASFAIIAAISSRLDTFITARLLDSVQIGIYAAANQLVQVVPQIVGAIGAVIAPKIASIKGKNELIAYLKNTQVMVLGLALLGFTTIPIVQYIIPYLFGPEYLDVKNVFFILMIAMLIFLVSVPIHQTVMHYYEYPKLFTILSFVDLVIIGIVGWITISMYGIVGAAVTVLITQLVNLVIPFLWVLVRLKKT